MAELKAQGIHFLAYINPYLIKDGEMYNYCKEKGYLIKNSAGEIYHIKSTTFDAGMMDLTHPDMVKYLKETIIIKNMLELGIDGYMADFGEYLPVDSVLYSSEDAKILHNEWPVIWARINREAVNDSGREKDVFFFTRSGYNAAQKYTTIMWNGDQHTDYSYDYGMPCVIPASINLGFSGLCATHSDVGGYISFGSLRRDAELFVRWMEMNTFSLLMRTHETVRPENNAQYDDEKVIKYSVKLTNVHKLIKPYLLHCMKETADGLPVMRAPFYEFNDMAEYKSDYVYMLGSDIFVAPVLLAGADRKKLFLPQGEWVHMFSGKSYQSGEQIVDAPLGSPAVFYRKDSEHKDLFEKVKNIN
ncbi:MAG: alpha-glucosidase [Clostridia bacterium]|nr:alpha-glucosidase [Clostridia bacterium]